jgi:hypothetical protein
LGCKTRDDDDDDDDDDNNNNNNNLLCIADGGEYLFCLLFTWAFLMSR